MTRSQDVYQLDRLLTRAEKTAAKFNSEDIDAAVAELERLIPALQTGSHSRAELEQMRERTERFQRLIMFLHNMLQKAVRSVAQPGDGCYGGQGGIEHRSSRALYERYG